MDSYCFKENSGFPILKFNFVSYASYAVLHISGLLEKLMILNIFVPITYFFPCIIFYVKIERNMHTGSKSVHSVCHCVFMKSGNHLYSFQ